MKKNKQLTAKSLRRTLSPRDLAFKTTRELQSLDQFLGQKRALEATIFGLGIKSRGYNLYAMGPSGIGKFSLVKALLEEVAVTKPRPSDWCYIYNFEQPVNPLVLKLPAGLGINLQKDMKLFIQELSTSILSAFDSDEYHLEVQEILDDFNKKRKTTTKKNLKDKIVRVPQLYKERRQKEKAIQLKYTLSVVKPLIDKLKAKYAEYNDIIQHLSAIEKDILEHVNEFVKEDENNILSFIFESPILLRYQVNVLVNNENTSGAPIIFEENPSYFNLICRVEHIVELGAQVTNFMLIKAGSLHKANGGYLIIEARKIKKDKHAWEGLKRALYASKIQIEPVEDENESVRPVSLDPMPIPLDVKVILLGNRHNYYTLANDDPDFNELFKVPVDFDEEIERNKSNIELYARLIATIIKRENLRHFHVDAVAAIIDYSSRIAGDKEKLSTHIRSIDDLIIESDYWAGMESKQLVKREHVKHALKAKIHRMDRTRQLYYEDIYRNFILINTTKKIVGQVNCLSVVKVGKFSYGHPTRVTATVRPGKEKLIDIQHAIDLAGPIHSKASLILANFLASRYNLDNVNSLHASLSLEQIYGEVEGDSASLGELCALLSALSEVPLKQSLAITGAMDQNGKALAIGGVNEKIEGFYDICKLRGLNHHQGVIIPAVNVTNLMLREDVVKAVQDKKFFIYVVDDIDDAIHLLTDYPAGKRNKKGELPEKSVNYLVEEKLRLFTEIFSRKNKLSRDR